MCFPRMDLDWKAARRGRGKPQRRDNLRHDVAFDVVPMQVNLHRLVGEFKEFWSVKVDKNYSIIFRFVKENVHDVDYLDYHLFE